jgi:hypothetical protein
LGKAVVNDPLRQQAKALLKAISYSGMIDLDYRLDRPNTNEYKLVDFNPRVGAQTNPPIEEWPVTHPSDAGRLSRFSNSFVRRGPAGMGLAFIFDTVELRANLTVHYGAGPEELQLTCGRLPTAFSPVQSFSLSRIPSV